MVRVPNKCPICGKSTHVASVKCDHCGTTFKNEFILSRFEKLDSKQTDFVLAFIECEGSIKDMEKRFDISYPTVKTRLAEIRRVLGLGEPKSYKQSVLDELEKGDIGVDEALSLIKSKE